MILAHDLTTGKDATVNQDLLVAGIEGTPLQRSTFYLLDTWFAPA